MEAEFKTHLLIGALGAAVLCVGGYGLYRETKRTSGQAPGGRAPGLKATLNEGLLPGLSRAALRIETPRVVLANSSGHEARVIGDASLGFKWSIQGGELESGADRETVLWKAGPSGDVILTCRGFDAEGADLAGAIRISIQPVPTISGFEAVPSILTQGGSAKLGWTAKDCRKLMLDPGKVDVAALTGPGLEVKPTVTTTYTLTASDDLGSAITRNVTLKVVPPPQVVSLRAEFRPEPADAFAVIGEFKDGKAELREGGTVLASGNTSPLRADLTGVKPGASLTLVVTNEAGASATGTLMFSARK